MTTFDQRGQKVNYQYNAAGNINFKTVERKEELVAELAKLQAEVRRAAKSGAFDEGVASNVESHVKKAVTEMIKPEPNKKTILTLLQEAKVLIEGFGAAAGLAEGLMQAAEAVRRFFS